MIMYQIIKQIMFMLKKKKGIKKMKILAFIG
jgi:hypothetical protein